MPGTLIVTGGSRGIGAACAIAGAASGFKVCVNYNASPDRAEDVAEAIRAGGGEAITVQADVSQEEQIVAMFERVDDDLGPVTALINNAGIAGRVGPITELDAEEVNRVLQMNLTSAMICAREAVKRMSSDAGGQGGTIVNITSAAAKLGGANQYLHYAASKAGMEAFTMGLGLEVAPQGIRVVGIRPGLIDTEIHADMGLPDRVAELTPTVPLGRAGTAVDIANAALWAIGDKAGYVTATTIEVTGGR
jgi:NAD(P)-dependent dehydrogenase (short-subunit alcohol dehydrogenase family)